MWYSCIQTRSGLLSLLGLLVVAEPQFEREGRQLLAATIASARANNLAHPRNTTELAFGPQPYEAPLLCIYPELIIPGAYGVELERGHSISEHIAVIANDIRPFIWQAFSMPRLEIVYWTKEIDDLRLKAIRSDLKVVLVTCSLSDDHVFE